MLIYVSYIQKQYEAYLLRVYGSQRENRSVAADSGLESQNDQETSPSPAFSKSMQANATSPFPYIINQEPALRNYKLSPNMDYENVQKYDQMLQRPADDRRNVNATFTEATTSPIHFENYSGILKNRPLLPSYVDSAWKYSSFPKTNAQMNDDCLKSDARKAADASSTVEHNLDNYIDKIKRLHTDLLRNDEHVADNSFENIDYDQDTSGDILNMTMSEKELLSSTIAADEELQKAKSKFRSFRDFARNNSMINNAKSSIDKSNVARHSWAVVREKLNHPGMSVTVPRVRIGQENVEWPSEAQAIPKLPNFDEARRLIQQNRDLFSKDDHKLADALKRQKSPEIEDVSDHEFKEENDGCIEDDYDDTVDIDSWMPYDLEEQVQEVHPQDNIRDRPRRKLESIEEVDQIDDEEIKESEIIKAEEVCDPVASNANETSEVGVDDASQVKSQGSLEENNRRQAENAGESTNNDEYMNSQQYYRQDSDVQQQYTDNIEYAKKYELQQQQQQQQQQQRQQRGEEQQYEYLDDSNAQNLYNNVDPRYSEYEDQQYSEGQYLDYENQQYQQYDMNQQYDPSQYDINQQYDPNEPYGQSEPGQLYQQYAGEYEKYQENETGDKVSGKEGNGGANYGPAAGYDYSKQPELFIEKGSFRSKEALGSDGTLARSDGEQQPVSDYEDQGESDVSKIQGEESEARAQGSRLHSSQDKPKSKDFIKSILDSDSESFIERNLSNTESDFDFN
jgi:hypothetical protein